MTRFAFVDAEKARYSVTSLCRLLKVSRSGYYAWATRAPSARAVADEVLTSQIATIFAANRRVYGARGSTPSSPRPASTSAANGSRV